MTSKITKISALLIFCSLSITVYAQLSIGIRSMHGTSFDTNANYIDGSPYVKDNFEIAKINQIKDADFSARFNALTSEMEILTKESEIIILTDSLDYEVEFVSSNRLYKTVSYVDDSGTTAHKFMVVLFENEKFSLLKLEHKEFIKKIKGSHSYTKQKPSRYEHKDKYFIKINDEVAEIPQKLKEIQKLFPGKEKKIKDYIKSNNIKLKEETDIIKLVQYLSADIN